MSLLNSLCHFFRRLARVALWPRTTMREILDAGRDRTLIPLVLLATVSAFVGDNKGNNVSGAMAHADLKTWLIVAGALVAGALVMFLLFYVCAWLAYFAGRFLEGQGDPRAVRSALAWGMAPLIWALVYRLPVAIFGPSRGIAQLSFGSDRWRIQPGQMSGGCLFALLIGLLEVTILVWWTVVASRTLAEAERFSAWRGFGTLVMVGITPLVIVVAAVLAMH